jgi:hypothetical protein
MSTRLTGGEREGGDGENREEDKKFLYHEITLSGAPTSSFMSQFTPQEGRSGGERRSLVVVMFRGRGGGTA